MNRLQVKPPNSDFWQCGKLSLVLIPFYICSSTALRPAKYPKQAGFPDDESDKENVLKRGMHWLGNDFGLKDASSSMFNGMSLAQWMSMQQNPQLTAAQSASAGLLPNIQSNLGSNDTSKLLSFQSTALNAPAHQYGKENQAQQLQQPNLSWPQQQQLQQLLQSTVNSQHHSPIQQQQLQQLLQSTLNSQQQAFPLQQPQQQIMPSSSVNNNQNLQQQMNFSHLHHQQQLMGHAQVQQNGSTDRTSFSLTSLPQDLQFHQQMEQSNLFQKPQQEVHLPQALIQQSLMQRSQEQKSIPQNLQEQKLQFQILQKLQQQQQQQQQHSMNPVSPCVETQLPRQPHTRLENIDAQQLHLSQKQMSGNSFASSTVLHSPKFPVNQLQFQPIKSGTVKAQSGPTDGDAPSCSTSPSTNNCQVFPSTFLNKNQQGRSTMPEGSAFDSAPVLAKDHRRSSDFEMKYDLPTSRGPDQNKYKGSSTDHLDRTSSATSHCLEAHGLHQSFSLPSFCLDGDIQSNSKNTLSFTANVDGLTPDALLSRGYDSGKDIQNLLSDYGSTRRDIETELSSAGINPHSFGIPDMSFKPGCSNDVAVNDAGVQNNGSLPNQTPRLRTYTKVQKRGSVGRTIDVTRYKGYESLNWLEDISEWKLVYY
ncbi:hypothetical protein Leryth_025928 [Lithospermum erythrorhizon]|nr:hypothetical protein Leryth_025928 [Lithospermum erythrorhizon]